ncbi:MarR family transcriptional regulator [Aldersonia sp. NBC_00410]|uniref:MarR family winged helix-turn-helix transcriptional regulator n=1 Tax=Aldersonia sp. NBC_00410 TaxID=2975954 RepID=UPI00225B6A65|nr:MarR family transcriptional regulator [Aldersonia sp. NBC_00410]MCX5043207.1 MarR family transcriptional regulator [Aldersonia sp. NBC_00410]
MTDPNRTATQDRPKSDQLGELDEGPEQAEDPLARDLAVALTKLQRVRDRTFAQMADIVADQLDIAVFHCLLRLESEGPMRAGVLAEALYADPSSVSRQVATLVKRGLVARVPDPEDGRACVLSVTDNGQAMVEDTRRRRTASVGKIVADWPTDDRADFVRLLEKFVGDYERFRPELLAALRRRLDATAV